MFSNREKAKNVLETASLFQLATVVNHSAAVAFLKTAGFFVKNTQAAKASLRILEP